MNSRYRPHTLTAVGVLALGFGLPDCDAVDTAREGAPSTAAGDLQSCRLPGFEGEALCGSLPVPENREIRNGRRIELFYAVLPGTGAERLLDPILVLQGGPGQSAVEKASFYAQFLAEVRERRDIVLVDQRGTGRSNPLDWEPEADALFDAPGEYIPRSWVAATLSAVRDGADLTRYTSLDAVEDLEAVRRALGQDRINLYGTSYGCRVALLYMSRYPGRVRTAVLKGVVPLSGVVGDQYARDAQAALDLLFADCAADQACSAAFPRLKADFAGVLAQLERQAASVQVQDPRSGDEVDLPFTREVFAHVTRMLLYSPATRSQLPVMIAQAARGDFSTWARLFVRMRTGLAQQLYVGMTMSVLAAEDCPRLDVSRAREAGRGTFLGDLFPRHLTALCEGWPARRLTPETWRAATVQTPVLLVSGRLDPATPPSWAAEAARFLPNSLHLIYPDAGHPAVNFTGLDALIGAFVDSGTIQGLDASSVRDSSPIPFTVP